MGRSPRTPGWLIATLIANAVACSFSGVSAGGDDNGSGSDAAPIDAAIDAKVFLDAPLPVVCNPVVGTAALGTCEPNGHCRIRHTGNGSVACPAGQYCDIECFGTSLSCIMGVDCSTAIGCDITCGGGGAGDNSCSDGG